MTSAVILTINSNVVLCGILMFPNRLVMIHIKRERLINRHLRRIRNRHHTVESSLEGINLTRQKILSTCELDGVLHCPLRQRHRRAIGAISGVSLPPGLDEFRQ
jgi:hypothetical protein